MAGVKREQTSGLESHVITRQDRGLNLTDGGNLTWDVGTGILAWSGTLRVRVPGVAAYTIASASATLAAVSTAAYVDLSGRTGGGTLTVLTSTLNSSLFEDDDLFILAIRGSDGKLYFCNGTVYVDGDNKAFGTLTSATERSEVTSTGVALVAVGFTYATGTDQLVVYVGGLLQKKILHYSETSSTQITFLSPYIPTSGELITFINVIGGQGPPGPAGGLQVGYDNGSSINALPGTPVQLDATTGVGSTPVFQVGNAVSPGGLAAFSVRRAGTVTANGLTLRDSAALESMQFRTDTAGNMEIFDAIAPFRGIRINDDGSGIEHGLGGGVFDGPLKWKVFTGTTATGAPTIIATGLTSPAIKWVMASINVSGDQWICYDVHSSLAGDKFTVSFDVVTGNVYIAADSSGAGAPGVNVQTKSYKVVVFM